MIWKIVLYFLIGAILNLGISAWILLWAVSKDKDESFAVTDDIMHEYTKLIIYRSERLIFWKYRKNEKLDELSEREVDELIDELDCEGLSRHDLLLIIIGAAILWPIEIFYTKRWTIPRIIEYAKKYDET